MKKQLFIFFCIAVVCCGCARFDYSGRSFDPVDESQAVGWYTPANPVPPGQFRVMGRGTLVFAAGKLDSYDIEDRLIAEARKHGADAVFYAGKRNISTGVYAVDNSVDSVKRAEFKSSKGVSVSKEQFEINSFDSPITLTGSSQNSTDTAVDVIFYKRNEYIRKYMDSDSVQIIDGRRDLK